AAYEIISRKGATYYAIASSLIRIAEAIIRNQSTVLTVSSHIQSNYGINDVYLSLPAVVNAGGVEKVLNLNLEANELKGLRNSADVLHRLLSQLTFD
ncbi:MAG TPA: L-lactate dehydrogenase, partial [Anaerolineaceae bacterium]